MSTECELPQAESYVAEFSGLPPNQSIMLQVGCQTIVLCTDANGRGELPAKIDTTGEWPTLVIIGASVSDGRRAR